VASYRSLEFNRMVMQRPLWMLWMLRQGYTVIQCDLDIVWLHDPRAHIQSLRYSRPAGYNKGITRVPPAAAVLDLAFQSEQAYGVNGGFYVAWPTARTVDFFERWIDYLRGMTNRSFEEQHALNGALVRARARGNITAMKLGEEDFPNGKIWWQYPDRANKSRAYVVHVNWVKANKKTRLVRDRLWFLDGDDSRCADGFDPFGGTHGGCDKGCSPVIHIGLGAGSAASRVLHTCHKLNAIDDHVARDLLRLYQREPREGHARISADYMRVRGRATLHHPMAYAEIGEACRRNLSRPEARWAHRLAFGRGMSEPPGAISAGAKHQHAAV